MSGTRLTGLHECCSAGGRSTGLGAAVLIAVAAIAMAAWAGRVGKPSSPPAEITLLYVGAEDCAPCRAWQNGEGAAFFASGDFPRISYREIKSPHLHDILRDENWPEELRSYRAGLKRSDGVPLWLIVVDRKVAEQRFGVAEWRASVLPTLKSLLP